MAKQEDFFDANLCLFLYFFFWMSLCQLHSKILYANYFHLPTMKLLMMLFFFDANKKNK